MDNKFEKINIRISIQEKQELKKWAQLSNCSMSEFIRQACKEKILKENYNARN